MNISELTDSELKIFLKVKEFNKINTIKVSEYFIGILRNRKLLCNNFDLTKELIVKDILNLIETYFKVKYLSKKLIVDEGLLLEHEYVYFIDLKDKELYVTDEKPRAAIVIIGTDDDDLEVTVQNWEIFCKDITGEDLEIMICEKLIYEEIPLTF